MNAKKKVLVTFMPLNDAHLDQLAQAAGDGCELVYKQNGLTADDVRDASAIVGNVPPALLPECKALELLQLNSAGADPYAQPGKLPEGARLTCASGAYGLTVSEHMLAMTFSLVRRFEQYARKQAARDWSACGNIISVEGATILLMGLGDIGGMYARKAHALGAHVIGLRRHLGDKPDYLDELHTMDDLDSLLPRADIVVMVLPGGKATDHLMDERRLRLMKKGALLINCGRGNAIDPAALKKVLRDGHLGGAALDVTEPEPLPADDELWNFDNVLITPHVAGWFFLAKTVDRIIDIAAQNLRAWTTGGELVREVDVKKGY
ncbi:MAG: D-2-hydroxyacid dehydrogenase [Pyramidobacter sp.]|nr:D-2-hydroxyacid dehydrogenase [Pyramidobacter sp.]